MVRLARGQLAGIRGRPARSGERGTILYALRHSQGGETLAIFNPRTLLALLCALAPLPRRHLLASLDVLATASTWRSSSNRIR